MIFAGAFGAQSADTLSPWIAIGPKGDFGKGNFPRNGRIRSLQIQALPNNDYYLYVGASSGGLWRARGSTGPVWTSLGDDLENPAVAAFAVHPENADDIVVGTGDTNRYTGRGMYHTMDGGKTWTRVNLNPSPEYFYRIHYLNYANTGLIIAASSLGLLRASSGADGSWNNVLPGKVTDVVLHPASPEVLYACKATSPNQSDGGVYESTDSGATWTRITAGNFGGTDIENGRLAICQDSPASVAWVYEQGGTFKAVLKSSDGGLNWQNIASYLSGKGGEAHHALSIAIQPDDPKSVFVGANQLWHTINDGQDQWKASIDKSFYYHDDLTQLYFSPVTGRSILWICNDGGIYRRNLGSGITDSWNGNGSSGLQVSQVSGMDAQRDLRVVALQDDGIAASADQGANWKDFENEDGLQAHITDDLNFTFWFTWWPGGPYRVLRQTFSGNQLNLSYSRSLSQLFYDRFTQRVFSLNGDTPPVLVSRAETGAGSWTVENVQLPGNPVYLKGSYLHGLNLYVWESKKDIMAVLRRNGASWTIERTQSVGDPKRHPGRFLKTLFASTDWPRECWAGLSTVEGTTPSGGDPGIVHTTDNWQTWDELGPLPTPVGQVLALAVPPYDSRTIYVGTDVGVYSSYDGGQTWQPFQTGLPRVFCTGLRYLVDHTRGGNDTLVVSTYGRGMYQRTIPRQPLVYVDQRDRGPNFFRDGTFERPLATLDDGIQATPSNGTMALNGTVAFGAARLLSKPMTIRAYEAPAVLR